MRFPTGKGIYGGQFDGMVSAAGKGYVPDGDSIWELSIEEPPGPKATRDYQKRLEQTNAEERSFLTYVAVSLKRFKAKREWIDERAEDGWKGVCFFDVESLSEWLDQWPVAQYQLVAKFGQATTRVRALEEWWDNWNGRGGPVPIGNDWLLSGRDQEVERLATVIQQARPDVMIGGVGQIDALGFLFSCIKTLPESAADYLMCRCLYVHDIGGWGEIGGVIRNAILIPMCGLDSRDLGLIDPSNTIVYCGHPMRHRDSIVVPPIRASALGERMRRDGVEPQIAEAAAKAARTSVELMRKELGATPVPFDLALLKLSDVQILSACLIANRWNRESDSDWQFVRNFAGTSVSQIESLLLLLERAPIPIFRRSGDVWFITDAGLAWSQFGAQVPSGVLEQFRIAAREVIVEDDPTYEMQPSERWTAGLLGKRMTYSSHLREGLGRTLSTLADTESQVGSYGTGQLFADDIVRSCLADSGPQRWFSLAPVLSLLAEAAPVQFLRALEADLWQQSPDSVAGLFVADADASSGGSRHCALLWALERLAWNSEYLPRAVRCLSRLAELGFGTSTGNSPLGSLREIFLPWHPSTDASPERRLAVLTDVRQEFPTISWKLLLALLPQDHSTANPTNRPELRDWGDASRPPTHSEYFRVSGEIVRAAAEDADTDVERLIAVGTAFAGYPDEWLNLALTKISEAEPHITASRERFEIWNALRQRLAQHQRQPDADWSMTLEQCFRYQSLLDRFTPTDPVLQGLWLFERWVELPGDDEDEDDRGELLMRARLRAVEKVWQIERETGIMRLAELCADPDVVGETVAQLEPLGAERTHALLHQNLAAPEFWRRSFSRGFLFQNYRSFGAPWIEEEVSYAAAHDWPPIQRTELLLTLENDKSTWNKAKAAGKEIECLYWERVGIWRFHPTSSKAIAGFARRVFKAGRVRELVHWLASMSRQKRQPRNLEVLFQALDHLSKRTDWTADEARELAHDVARILEVLADSEEARDPRLGIFEFFYIPLVQFYYQPRAIARGMATTPDFFLEILQMRYRSTSEHEREPTPEEHAMSQAAYTILREWRTVPGWTGDTLDEGQLLTWTQEVRSKATETGYLKSADACIGDMLGRSAPGPDGVWPHEGICKLIEIVQSDTLDRNVSGSKRNTRGVTTRFPDAGGSLERIEEKRFREWADARRIFRRTQTLLEQIAEMYAEDAVQEDRSASMQQDL